MIKAVIFGMDGVLIDTEKWHYQYWHQAVKEAGFEIHRAQMSVLCDGDDAHALRYLSEMFGSGFPCEKAGERKRELMRKHVAENSVKRKTGARDVLDYLRANQIRTAAAVPGDASCAKDCLERAGLLEKIDNVFLGTMMEGSGKPEYNLYRYACEQLGCKAEECIAVEAFPAGARAAASAGLYTVMVSDLVKPQKEEEGMVRAQIDTLYDIILMLEDGII